MGIGKIIRPSVVRPAIFLDRDGVLNPTVLNPANGRMESPLRPQDFRLIDGEIPVPLKESYFLSHTTSSQDEVDDDF